MIKKLIDKLRPTGDWRGSCCGVSKPTVSVELTESELWALFGRMDRHPSIRGKVTEALGRMGPVRRAANRGRKAERMRRKEQILKGADCEQGTA